MDNKRNRQKRVKGSDMGKGAAKRKRPRVERVKVPNDDRRKTSVPCVERVKVPDDDWREDSTPPFKWKGFDENNEPYDKWEDSTPPFKWKGFDENNKPYVKWEGSLRKEDSTRRVKWKGYSYDDENRPYVEWEGSLRKEDSTPRKRVELIRSSADDGEPGVSEDELLRQHLEKVGTTASGDYEQALQRTLDQFPSASTDMKQSGRKEIDGRRFAEIFSLQGNNAMQSKLYSAAIDYYKAAIVLGGDKAIYYCNRAAAYIQTCQYAEAILDCKKSIAIDPNYIEAYVHLGYICFGLGIDAALEKGYIATHLDPTNESVREGVREAEHKVCQQRKESGQNSNWSYSSGVMSVRDQVPPPLFGDKSGAAGELHAAIRAAYHVALHYKTTTLM